MGFDQVIGRSHWMQCHPNGVPDTDLSGCVGRLQCGQRLQSIWDCPEA